MEVSGYGKQLTIYSVLDNNGCSDKDLVSLQENRSDAKKQAIQRFLNSGRKDPSVCVNTYSPGRRQVKYYRLSYEFNGKKKHIHIRGGNTKAKLATYRANVLRAIIDRGADLAEIIAAVNDFNNLQD